MATRRIEYPMTAEEFAVRPAPDDAREELVRGFVVREPRPGVRHGAVVAHLVYLLKTHLCRTGFGGTVLTDTGFVVFRRPDQVRSPDVAYVSAGRIDVWHSGFAEGAADLAVEVLAPHDRPGETAARLSDQFRAGARCCWVVDPAARTVIVHRPDGMCTVLTAGDVLDGGDVLPGLAIPVVEVFAI